MQDSTKIWAGEMEGYKLLDCGDKKKLEEIRGVRIVRAEPRAWWKRELSENEWRNTETVLETIVDIFEGVKAKIKFKSGSKHIGIFPEQISQWQWIAEKLKTENSKPVLSLLNGLKIPNSLNVLNLFGYTGIASLVAARAGARITHVDASKASIDWARENQKLSELEDAPIRWILDDVLKFINKEKRQGKKYDCLIMDPPQFGKGPKGEIWKIEEKLPELLKACREILSDEPLFVIFNMYATELSSLSVANLLRDTTKGLNGRIESGELVIKQENSTRLLPMSIFALWCAK
ncbi:MAG: hypothetical protein A3A96_00160 [Candidatus Zambryskibacteria bacterium RIFCSPLOWO2_01_FULL_39_39]|uniref:S-adenosylmethionine-dependent methyltransferase domain-containing protein n=1 Tax=Candidatus Zambryskibacteria bacterium RIFCSPLOWO2_01_FULL_39_39 TaxID=1802758 RepID=A0A1G2TX11_9BACT|nr:MAG: hypothetical protein UT00_C0001G0070 [Parcubacteria group bacterium GW2011_GWA1_38_7]OHA87460.1 MAG: hypothetical protein A2644_02780 [Candidatus Zambryskibacteria bacterium RIFCSPHIGHO2_01_FULL_39_63]OHA94900.1 MAG: hypothetical protein A3B88_00780 [Candidatus Zambryskibacteria bacterium RIFCSPHIGHO2_02_FULL_39_19]OHA99080.1 MAG: hypothetical protein A3F20_02730 [Candidatus Zambryskibacteria bacterium RIFCSPHIGHO2_12_FULL_39_21]OHB01841.1 MAG: hypothetical protein A3A96_00160 [Candidat